MWRHVRKCSIGVSPCLYTSAPNAATQRDAPYRTVAASVHTTEPLLS